MTSDTIDGSSDHRKQLNPPSQKSLRSAYKAAQIPKRFRTITLEDYEEQGGDEEAVEAVRAYLDNLHIYMGKGDLRDNPRVGRGLLLWGEPGHGKSLLAAILARTLIDMNLSGALKYREKFVHYTTYPEMVKTHLNKIALERRQEQNEEDIEKLRELESLVEFYSKQFFFLVIDDVGKEHTTRSNWVESELDYILRTRFDRAKPTIITSNNRPEDWTTKYSEAMGSFIQEAYISVEVDSRDFRETIR